MTADDSGDCSEYWLVDKVVGDVKFSKCCTTKCNGKSDFVYEGTFFDCKAGTCSGMFLWCLMVGYIHSSCTDDIEAPPLPHERDPFLAWKV